MLKKAKKSRRNATSSITNARLVSNEISPSSSQVHPCIFSNIDSGPLMHERSTSDSACANGDDDDDEEGDAFL